MNRRDSANAWRTVRVRWPDEAGDGAMEVPNSLGCGVECEVSYLLPQFVLAQDFGMVARGRRQSWLQSRLGSLRNALQWDFR